MNRRCENSIQDVAVDVCDSCYGEFCDSCLVQLKTRKHPLCKDCAVILSGVRGRKKPVLKGEKATANERRKELKTQTDSDSADNQTIRDPIEGLLLDPIETTGSNESNDPSLKPKSKKKVPAKKRKNTPSKTNTSGVAKPKTKTEKTQSPSKTKRRKKRPAEAPSVEERTSAPKSQKSRRAKSEPKKKTSRPTAKRSSAPKPKGRSISEPSFPKAAQKNSRRKTNPKQTESTELDLQGIEGIPRPQSNKKSRRVPLHPNNQIEPNTPEELTQPSLNQPDEELSRSSASGAEKPLSGDHTKSEGEERTRPKITIIDDVATEEPTDVASDDDAPPAKPAKAKRERTSKPKKPKKRDRTNVENPAETVAGDKRSSHSKAPERDLVSSGDFKKDLEQQSADAIDRLKETESENSKILDEIEAKVEAAFEPGLTPRSNDKQYSSVSTSSHELEEPNQSDGELVDEQSQDEHAYAIDSENSNSRSWLKKVMHREKMQDDEHLAERLSEATNLGKTNLSMPEEEVDQRSTRSAKTDLPLPAALAGKPSVKPESAPDTPSGSDAFDTSNKQDAQADQLLEPNDIFATPTISQPEPVTQFAPASDFHNPFERRHDETTEQSTFEPNQRVSHAEAEATQLESPDVGNWATDQLPERRKNSERPNAPKISSNPVPVTPLDYVSLQATESNVVDENHVEIDGPDLLGDKSENSFAKLLGSDDL